MLEPQRDRMSHLALGDQKMGFFFDSEKASCSVVRQPQIKTLWMDWEVDHVMPASSHGRELRSGPLATDWKVEQRWGPTESGSLTVALWGMLIQGHPPRPLLELWLLENVKTKKLGLFCLINFRIIYSTAIDNQ